MIAIVTGKSSPFVLLCPDKHSLAFVKTLPEFNLQLQYLSCIEPFHTLELLPKSANCFTFVRQTVCPPTDLLYIFLTTFLKKEVDDTPDQLSDMLNLLIQGFSLENLLRYHSNYSPNIDLVGRYIYPIRAPTFDV